MYMISELTAWYCITKWRALPWGRLQQALLNFKLPFSAQDLSLSLVRPSSLHAYIFVTLFFLGFLLLLFPSFGYNHDDKFCARDLLLGWSLTSVQFGRLSLPDHVHTTLWIDVFSEFLNHPGVLRHLIVLIASLILFNIGDALKLTK